jgi:multiple sugar transport system permease protein
MSAVSQQLRSPGGAQHRFGRADNEQAAWLFVLPVAIPFIVFTVLPALATLALTFFSWNFTSPPQFVGLAHWIELFSGSRNSKAVVVTVVLALMTVPPTMIIGLLLAVALDRLPLFQAFFRTVFFAPLVTSTVAMAFVFQDIFRGDGGLINHALLSLGFDQIRWLINPNTALITVAILKIWSNSGFAMIIYLAGLQQLDRSVVEAAAVDGANRWDMFWRITLPLLGRSTFFLLVTLTIGAMQEFEAVYVLTDGGPGVATATIQFNMVREMFRYFDAGSGAVAAIALFVIMAIITLIQLRFQRRFHHD